MIRMMKMLMTMISRLLRDENPEQRLAALISPSQLPRLQRPRFASSSTSSSPLKRISFIKIVSREAAASPGSSLASLNSVGLPKAQWDPVGPGGTQWDSVGPNRAQWDQDSVGLPTPRPSPRPSAHACALPQACVNMSSTMLKKSKQSLTKRCGKRIREN